MQPAHRLARSRAAVIELVADRTRLMRLLPRAGVLPASVLLGLYLVGAAFPVLNALVVGHLVAVLSRSAGEAAVLAAAGLLAGLLIIDQCNWLVRTLLKAIAARRIDGWLRMTVRQLAIHFPGIDELESPAFHDRAARAVDRGVAVDRTRSAGYAVAGQLELSYRMVSAVAAAGLLAFFSPLLASGLLIVALAVRAMLRRQWMHLIEVLDADMTGQRRVNYLAELAVTGAVKEIRLFDLGDFLGRRFRAGGLRAYGRLWREMWKVLRRQWWTLALVVVASATALAVPGAAALSGRIDSGKMITYVLAGASVLAITSMGREAYDIEYGLRGVHAADELLARFRPPRLPETRAARERAPAGAELRPPAIRFEDVTFRYPGLEKPTLDGLSLTLLPGQTVAIVGANGVGKTTLVKLLAGLYQPTAGRITVDGIDLAELDPAGWRRRLSVLFQDFVQYPATLRDNVRLAAPELADDEAVLNALDLAGLQLDGLPAGLDTQLWREGTGGTDLSGGQWQRVALARVLFAATAGRSVLVLDEPTAHLDVRAEAEFHERVVQRVAGVTTLLISHRLSTVRPAERILLLRDGRVAEDGSHAQLIALNGEYARFFTIQAETFTAGQGAQ